MLPFQHIPPNLRVPLFQVEFSTAANQLNQQDQKSLIVAQSLVAQAAVPVYCSSVPQAIAMFGAGSMAAQMVAAYRNDDTVGELWVLPLADAGGAAAAVASIVFGGPATANGTIALYIGGTAINVAVTTGQTAAQIATAAAAACAAYIAPNGTTLPVTAAVDGVNPAKVNFTAVHKGLLGNDIDIRLNYFGLPNGEQLPAGVTAAVTAMAGGTVDPDLGGIAATIADNPFDFIAVPYTGAADLDEVKAMMNDTAGRWSYQRQSFGHAFSAKRFYGANEAAAAANAITFGAARNDPHVSVLGFFDSPSNPWAWAAEFMGAFAVASKADPARPSQTLALAGVLAPPLASRFSFADKQALLSNGVALADYANDGTVSILRSVTTYQFNAFGSPDQSYLDAETLFTLMAVVRALKAVTTQKFPRSKLAADGTNFGAGQAIVTPKSYRAELIAEYARLIDQGLVQDAADFAAGLVVELNANDASRLDVLCDPILVSGLRVLAMIVQFRLLPPAA